MKKILYYMYFLVNIKIIYSDILRVALPSLAAALCEPILSLVDTYCIGQMPSEIAASTGLAGMLINTVF